MATATRREEAVDGSGAIVDLREAPGSLEAITRAEVDVQIATARKYPRSVERFLAEARSMVGVSQEVAEKCRYCLPPRKGGGEKSGPIEGPSVRLAEIVACAWGNLRIVGRIVGDDGRFLTAQGVALDLEKNLGYSVEVPRGVRTRDGRRYGDDMVKTTALAAIAIATRNATFKAVPRALVGVIEEEALAVARGSVKTLPERLERAVAYFAAKGVAAERVYGLLGVAGPAEVTLDHLMTLTGYRNAVAEGHASVAELFEPRAEPRPERGTEGLRKALGPAEPAFAPGTPGRVGSEDDEAPAGREPGEDG